MPLAAAFHQHLITLWLQFVIVAGHHVPAQNTAKPQPAGFGVVCEGRGFFGLEPHLPLWRMFHTVIAGHGEIGIRSRREADLREGPGSAPATAGEEGGNRRAIVKENQAAGGQGGLCRERLRGRRFAKELAVSRIAEIELGRGAIAKPDSMNAWRLPGLSEPPGKPRAHSRRPPPKPRPFPGPYPLQQPIRRSGTGRRVFRDTVWQAFRERRAGNQRRFPLRLPNVLQSPRRRHSCFARAHGPLPNTRRLKRHRRG